MYKKGILFIGGIIGSMLPFTTASAHEAYVLPSDTFWGGLQKPFSISEFDGLWTRNNIHVTLMIVTAVLVLLGLNFLFRQSILGQKTHAFIERYAWLGPHAIRITIAAAFFFSAASNTFLGPELLGTHFFSPHLLQIALYCISIMIALGMLTELAATVGIIIFISSFFIFGRYMLTYLNYLGELIVLLLFGMRVCSVDRSLFGPLRRFPLLAKYETVIVRVMYGAALLYAAIAVKILHPGLTIEVVNTWHLTQFHWLFPSDPLLITFGAGIVESIIGLFIIFGFEMRLIVLISLFYITLSLFYFREMVWPHLLLYGISFHLLVQPEIFTIDHILFDHHQRAKPWWKRPFSAHRKAETPSL